MKNIKFLDTLTNKEIFEQINKIKVNEIPQNLVDQEIQILFKRKDEDKEISNLMRIVFQKDPSWINPINLVRKIKLLLLNKKCKMKFKNNYE